MTVMCIKTTHALLYIPLISCLSRGALLLKLLWRQVRPFITPSIAAACKRHVQAPRSIAQQVAASRPLVLVDSDSEGRYVDMMKASCKEEPALRHCRVVQPKRTPRPLLLELLKNASVVVDRCLIGSERMPLEAVLCGAIMVTWSCQGGKDPRDFPLPPSNLLPAVSGRAEFVALLHDILSDLPAAQLGMQQMRDMWSATNASSMRAEVAGALEVIAERASALLKYVSRHKAHGRRARAHGRP